MAIDHREIAFEAAIEHHLLNVAGYSKADPTDFDRDCVAGRLRAHRSALVSAAVTGKLQSSVSV